MLHYEDLKNKPRELLVATGLKPNEFEALLVVFAQTYEEGYPAEQTMEDCGKVVSDRAE